jgi:tRNA G10  N-methylase Trm11
MTLLFLLGRTPNLSKKEIEAIATILPTSLDITMIQGQLVELKLAQDISLTQIIDLQRRLGGTTRIAEFNEETIPQSNLVEKIVETLQQEGKKEFGLSIFGSGLNPLKLGLIIKKQAKVKNLSLRLIEGKEGQELSSAQVFQLNLTEIILVQKQKDWQIAVTRAVQDIDTYVAKDFGLPSADALSGMLPPKLARIMVNIATAGFEKGGMVYDPFCGNGRVVLEAHDLGFSAFGSDIDSKKVESAAENIEWVLSETTGSQSQIKPEVWIQDATDAGAEDVLATKIKDHQAGFAIVGEPYLGRPLRDPLTPEQGKTCLLYTSPSPRDH